MQYVDSLDHWILIIKMFVSMKIIFLPKEIFYREIEKLEILKEKNKK